MTISQTPTTWYYVVYQDEPKGKKYLSSKHRNRLNADIAILRKQADRFWNVYFWSIQETQPIASPEDAV